MIFTPSVLGPQSTTLSIIVPFGTAGPACPKPNLFTARGVSVAPYSAGREALGRVLGAETAPDVPVDRLEVAGEAGAVHERRLL